MKKFFGKSTDSPPSVIPPVATGGIHPRRLGYGIVSRLRGNDKKKLALLFYCARVFEYPLFIFLAAAAWFAAFIPWNGFNDPDAFYHAKIASLMMRAGPLHRFPWLDLTFFDRHFTDLHFFFHVLLMPFERAFGMYAGAQIAAVFFAALFIAVFYAILRRARVPMPWVFTILLALIPLQIIRLTLAKASPVALIWFILGLAAVSLPQMKLRLRMIAAFIIGFGFAFTHGGWSILIICQSLFAFGECLFERVALGRSWRASIFRPAFVVAGMSLLGALLAMIAHPNFPANMYFLWVQIWKIAIVTPFHRVRLGNEWLPINIEDFIGNAAMTMIVGLVIFYGLLIARRKPEDADQWRASIAWGLPVAFLAAVTFKSIRFAEYFFPALVWWVALLAANVDVRAYWRMTSVFRRDWRARLLIAIILGSLATQTVLAWREIRVPVYPFGAYQEVFRVLASKAEPNERVFNASWDMFPQLFAEDDHYHYVLGLDPTFLLEKNPALSDRYQSVMMNKLATSTYDVIKNDFGSRWVVLDPRRQADLDRVMENDSRFELQASSTRAKLYMLE